MLTCALPLPLKPPDCSSDLADHVAVARLFGVRTYHRCNGWFSGSRDDDLLGRRHGGRRIYGSTQRFGQLCRRRSIDHIGSGSEWCPHVLWLWMPVLRGARSRGFLGACGANSAAARSARRRHAPRRNCDPAASPTSRTVDLGHVVRLRARWSPEGDTPLLRPGSPIRRTRLADRSPIQFRNAKRCALARSARLFA